MMKRSLWMFGVASLTWVSTAEAASSWEHLGPGGSGRFTQVIESPSSSILYASNDISGVFKYSVLTGEWKNISNNLTDTKIKKLALTGNFVLAATDGGIFSSLGGGPWSQAMDFSGAPLNVPFQSLAVDNFDPTLVYAGVGDVYGHELSSSTVFSHHIYVSTDSGQTFSPSLSFSSSTGASSEGIVYSLRSHPTNAKWAYAATSEGLFYTQDAGAHWQELGAVAPRVYSAGAWSSSVGTCVDQSGIDPVTGVAEVQSCLPKTQTTRNVPDVRDVVFAATSSGQDLFVSIWDSSAATCSSATTPATCSGKNFGTGAAVTTQTGCTCTASGALTDHKLIHYRGGVWRSSDAGATFGWTHWDYASASALKVQDVGSSTASAPFKVKTTSNTDSSFRNSNFGPLLGIPNAPGSSSQFQVIGVRGGGHVPGIYTYDGTSQPWKFWSNSGNDSCRDGSCVEGGSVGGLAEAHSNSLFAGNSLSGVSGKWPEFRMTTARSVVEIRQFNSAPTSTSPAIQVDHLTADYDSATSLWTGSPLDSTCNAAGVAFFKDSAGVSKVLYGVLDGGVFIGDLSAGGYSKTTWTRPSASWPVRGSDTQAVLAVTSGTMTELFASNEILGEGASVLSSTDGGANWSVLGGYGYLGSSENGLSALGTQGSIFELKGSAKSGQTLVLAGTHQGVYLYQASRSAGAQWTQLDTTSCGAGKVRRILSPDELGTRKMGGNSAKSVFGSHYFFVSESSDASSDGVYAVSESSLSGSASGVRCIKILGSNEGVVHPRTLALNLNSVKRGFEIQTDTSGNATGTYANPIWISASLSASLWSAANYTGAVGLVQKRWDPSLLSSVLPLRVPSATPTWSEMSLADVTAHPTLEKLASSIRGTNSADHTVPFTYYPHRNNLFSPSLSVIDGSDYADLPSSRILRSQFYVDPSTGVTQLILGTCAGTFIKEWK